MDFCYALNGLKEGMKASRPGWNGKAMWIAIKEAPDSAGIYPFPTMTVPFIFMKTADDKFVPWLASQTDMLAEDWEVMR